jgi:hypothetical protein
MNISNVENMILKQKTLSSLGGCRACQAKKGLDSVAVLRYILARSEPRFPISIRLAFDFACVSEPCFLYHLATTTRLATALGEEW